ncbi:threonine synthase [Paenibacillus thalictri]|uniref:Threonine synthase n=1 Tax=Paenibacillus thalictri TaxID=2527873 RepID=A0A4Q9DYM3_9BACL|nr:threonine synthase [Paenibacillus thalictri]TBL81210.1 threonine synthase [Paenibacillus thalictri]
MKWICETCNLEYPGTRVVYRCDCGELLDLRQETPDGDAERLKRTFDKRLSERSTVYASGVWRYKELILPELPDSAIVTKFEGNTGMYVSQPVNRFAGLRRVHLKALSENPSGSFKDHGMTAAVSYGSYMGYTKFICSSTGNTSSSLAMYAAMAGHSAYVLLPDKNVSPSKMLQTLAYGAQVLTFGGTYDDGIRFSERHGAELGLYSCNSINPLRIEGQKSIVFEVAHALGWTLPDWIVLPGGALSNATALGKGLADLHRIGLIDRVPRVAIVQAEGASPFHRMVEGGRAELVPEAAPSTRASALNIGNPPSWKKALRYVVEAARGNTVSVSDEEIMEAKTVIDRSGIGCEPASAASLAGLRKLVQRQVIDKDETAVCLLTGNMLKDTAALAEVCLHGAYGQSGLNQPVPVELKHDVISRCIQDEVRT